jgi:trans-2,3-dihydro-3-hydroxyanthranilate isomerase
MMTVRRLKFVWVDVFAENPLEGNQLAVFPDAHGLNDEEMQAIARETHLSETTFVFPERDTSEQEQGIRTRIFTISEELPFAGHPTLGTASVLSELRGSNEIALGLKVGRIPVTFTNRDGRRFGEMVQKDPTIGATHDPNEVAKALGVAVNELDTKYPVQTLSTGAPFAIVPFRSREKLSRFQPNWSMMEAYLKRSDARFFYLISRETVDPSASLHARMIFSSGEDPATGSAAGPAIAWMVLHGLAKARQELIIEQGLEIQRRSHIYGRADLKDGQLADVRVGGHCTRIIDGQLTLSSA